MTMRSRPWKAQPTVRLLLIENRLRQPRDKREKPRRIARWWIDRITGRGQVLTGHADQSRTRTGRRYRLRLRIKRRVATWFRRREL